MKRVKKFIPYEFTLTNICSKEVDYYINLEKVIDDASRAFMLADGTLLENESKTFNLRLWLSDDTHLNDMTMNKTYQGKITVLASYVPNLVEKNMMRPITMKLFLKD